MGDDDDVSLPVQQLLRAATRPVCQTGQAMERREGGGRLGRGVEQVVRMVTVWGHLWARGGGEEGKVQEDEGK